MLGTMRAVSMVLTARMNLTLAVIGGFGLAYLTMTQADAYRLMAMAIYEVGIVAPLVYLALKQGAMS